MALQQLREWLLTPDSYESKLDMGNAALASEPIDYHRRILVISGDEAFCRSSLSFLMNNIPENIQVGSFTGSELKGKNRKVLLGSERDIGILHCHESFSPGNVMALAGTVKTSGCLILVTPALKTWPYKHDFPFISHGYSINLSAYITRVVQHLNADKRVALHSQENTYIPEAQSMTVSSHSDDFKIEQSSTSLVENDFENGSVHFLSSQQKQAFNALCEQYSNGNLNTIVSAPRGRGKSTLLGIFAWYLLCKGKRVLLTSTLIDNVHVVFNQLEKISESTQLLKMRKISDKKYILGDGVIEWMAPDNTLLKQGNNDVILIDEAASFPLPMLFEIVEKNCSWVLSTTIQGYEGSGSGFLHKLMPRLTNFLKRTKSTDLNQIELTTPLRWLENDPIEDFLRGVFLFEDVDASSTNELSANSANSTDELRQKQLNDEVDNQETSIENHLKSDVLNIQPKIVAKAFTRLNEAELSQVMSLLALAHYQTSPDDLMRLMDSPDLILFVHFHHSRVVGAAVVNKEGGNALQELGDDIAIGKRRPKGHLSAQRITLLTANGKNATLTYWRINRIAVHPKYQRKGFGKAILSEIKQAASRKKVDFLTTSYGIDEHVNMFWAANHFKCVYRGEKRNKASGEVSALSIYSLSSRAKEVESILNNIYESHRKQLPFIYISYQLQDLYIKKLSHFVSGYRHLESVWPIVSSLAKSISENACRYNNTIKRQDSCSKHQASSINFDDCFHNAIFATYPQCTSEKLIPLLSKQELDYATLAGVIETSGKKETNNSLKCLVQRFLCNVESQKD